MNAPEPSGLRNVSACGSQPSKSEPVRHTITDTSPLGVKCSPETVTVATSGRFVDGSTAISGPGSSGESGSKCSGARAARGDDGEPSAATSTHGSAVVRQSISPFSLGVTAETTTSARKFPAPSTVAKSGVH